MKDWQRYFTQKIVTEEYYIQIPTQYDVFHFRVRYVKHNGFTLILPIDHEHENLSQFGAMFIDWFKWHQAFNTRFDKPGWWKKVRFNRKKKLIIWSIMSVQKAYDTFKQEMIDNPINQ